MTAREQLTLGATVDPVVRPMGDGACWLRAFASPLEHDLRDAIVAIDARAPFRRMTTPGGFTMSAALTSAGELGWTSDATGYRYAPTDPSSGKPWPCMPAVFRTLARGAAEAAGYPCFEPDSCLVNRYEPGARMSLHRDANERDYRAPIVSVSLGLPMTFLWGGAHRKDPTTHIGLESGDVVVWGGASRLTYHGVLPLKEGTHSLFGAFRFNLTFRVAG